MNVTSKVMSTNKPTARHIHNGAIVTKWFDAYSLEWRLHKTMITGILNKAAIKRAMMHNSAIFRDSNFLKAQRFGWYKANLGTKIWNDRDWFLAQQHSSPLITKDVKAEIEELNATTQSRLFKKTRIITDIQNFRQPISELVKLYQKGKSYQRMPVISDEVGLTSGIVTDESNEKSESTTCTIPDECANAIRVQSQLGTISLYSPSGNFHSTF